MLMATKGINLSLVYMTVKAIEKSVKLHGLPPPKNTASQPVPSEVSKEKKCLMITGKKIYLFGL